MRKYIHKRNLLMLLMIFIWSIGFFMMSYGEEKFDIEVKAGFNGYFKYGQMAPIEIKIKNNDLDLDGKIQVLLENDSEPMTYTAFSKKINIAKGTTKTINMKFLVDQDIKPYGSKLRIVDHNEKVVFEKDINITAKINSPKEKTIGVFSDDIESLRYLGSTYITLNNGKKSFYDVETINDVFYDAEILGNFNVIVINNYPTQKYTKEKIVAIKEWVDEGGTLFIGTGVNKEKTLKGLEGIIKTNPFAEEDDDKKKVASSSFGKGKVILSSFDLGMKPFLDDKEKEAFISETLEKEIKVDENRDEKEDRGFSHGLRNFIRYIPHNRLPSIYMIFIILAIFIILVGPINYMILKKIDKREKAWITIPAIAIIFSIGIDLWGMDTTFKRAFANNISIITINQDTHKGRLDTATGMMAAQKGDIDIQVKKNVHILPLDRYNRYDFKNKKGAVTLEYLENEEKHIIMKNQGLWDIETMYMKKIYDYEKPIEIKVSLKKDEIVGKIKNSSNLKLEDAVLIYGNEYEKLGDIEKGASKEIQLMFKKKTNKKPQRNGYYQILDAIYPEDQRSLGSRMKNAENEKSLTNVMKREILGNGFENYLMDGRSDTLNIVAWNQESIAEDIKINGKVVDRIDRTLIIIPAEIDYVKGTKIEIPKGMWQPNVIDRDKMHVEWSDDMLWGEGYAVFSMKPQINMEIEAMEISFSNYHVNENYQVYIYNYQTQEWQKYDQEHFTIQGEDKDKYYDENRGAKIKIDALEDMDIEIPDFSVKGAVR
ncbi:MAG: hypothetical protein N4A64_07740 [Marinisporobacter sp.]|jgi:hypothetical protein|nr:hypothetical protein [Marinisporobacter sp.]